MTSFARLTDREVSLAWPDSSRLAASEEEAANCGESPIEALRAVIRPHVLAGQCFVLFSGGRDSSVVLAIAAAVAQEAGVSPPVPVTAVHANAPEADEAVWQVLVLGHLGLTNRVVLEMAGEQSLLSQAAEESLRIRGLLWPPSLHVQSTYVAGLGNGSLLSGEGGDGVISGRRITPLVKAVRGLHPRAAARATRALVQHRWSPGAALETFLSASPWLTPEGRNEAAHFVAHMKPEPLSWRAGLLSTWSSRPAVMARRNFLQLFRDLGYASENPLENDRFVTALGRAGGALGLGTRTDMMRLLFQQYLPDAVLARSTKASFNAVRWTGREIDFARAWSGEGLDRRVIDSEALRSAWLSDEPPVLSDLHLHAAWLADNGLPLDPHAT